MNLAAAKNREPSEILQVDDEYTAFCFDEACNYIVSKIKAGKEPQYEKKKKKVKSMAEYFKELGV